MYLNTSEVKILVCHLWWYFRNQLTLRSWKAKYAVNCEVTGYYYFLLLHLIQILSHLLNHYYLFQTQVSTARISKSLYSSLLYNLATFSTQNNLSLCLNLGQPASD